MLDIKKRIAVINALVLKDTTESLTYAAIESRLTIEYLCYERFKLWHPYLSAEDLKKWMPKDVVKQVAEDVDENVIKGFTLSISSEPLGDKSPVTKEDYESMEYIKVGEQSALDLNKLHQFWQALSNVALHIPVPTISSGKINIYGEKVKIKEKIESFIEYLSGLNGNLLMGGPLDDVFKFNCVMCGFLIKKPAKRFSLPSVVSCINPKCNESYLLEPTNDGEGFEYTRRVFNYKCNGCGCDLDVPANVFRKLKFNEQVDVVCTCTSSLTVIMHPLTKESVVDNK